MSAQVRGASASPRLITSAPSEVSTNLATAPSLPNTLAISAGLASSLEARSNGYLADSVRW
jgi:hypothetical protein